MMDVTSEKDGERWKVTARKHAKWSATVLSADREAAADLAVWVLETGPTPDPPKPAVRMMWVPD